MNIKNKQKEKLLDRFKRNRKDFLNLEKDIYKEFHNLSLNEVLELKSQLSRLSFQVKYCAKQLEQHFKIFIDLEKRAWKMAVALQKIQHLTNLDKGLKLWMKNY